MRPTRRGAATERGATPELITPPDRGDRSIETEETIMDAYYLDRLALAIAGRQSRRGVLRAAVAGAAALGIRGAGAAGTCIANGRACKRGHGAACCSGICRKRHGKRVCKPAPGAL